MQFGNVTNVPNTILIVDDEKAIRLVLRTLLEMHHFQVLEAEDGLVALDLLNRQHIDLILSDIQMPNCGGIELFGQMKRSNFEIPFVFMTSYPKISKSEAIHMGAYAMILKPLNFNTILTTLHSALPVFKD